MVFLIAGLSVAAFIPSLPVAGVPLALWPQFIAGVVAAGLVIATSLLAVRAESRLALVGALASALVVIGLDHVIGAYYHELPLLMALLVVGESIIQGFRASLVVALCGSVIAPLVDAGGTAPQPVDVLYAFVYLFGLAAIMWTYARLMARGARALAASETRHRALVEQVPAVVYETEVGPDGAWLYVNPRVEGLVGVPGEVLRQNPSLWWNSVHRGRPGPRDGL